ncbi:MAG: hypothetical protein D6731_00930 [Planctomycetota bacterium]|nr:MAG: hypothetical protein D6731_00930 [Planctomycetota bacterium]
MSHSRPFLTLAGLSLLWSGAVGAAEIETLGGELQDQVVRIAPERGRLVVSTRRRSLPLESVKSIRFRAVKRESGAAKLLLAGGDVLRANIEGGDDEAVGIHGGALGRRRVPLDLLRAVFPAVDPERERALMAELATENAVDWVRLRNGGTVKGSLSAIDGVRVVLDTDVEGGSRLGEMSLDLAKVELVSIAPLDDPPPPPQGVHVVARLIDGSSLTAELVDFREGTLRLRHPLAGSEPLAVPETKLAELVVRGGRFVYLSDLEPVKVEQRFPPEYTYEVSVWGYKRDASVTGGPLRLGGKRYEKGLGVHSYCALTYALDGNYDSFRAVVGLDDSTRTLGEPGFGAVVFQVLLDGKPAKELPTGLVKRKGDEPTRLAIDVRGKRSLTLVADFDPVSLHVLGRADWADAHLLRSR